MSHVAFFNSEKEAINQIGNDQIFSAIFQRHLPQAQKRILHQLIQAIVRENVVKVDWIRIGEGFEVKIPAKNDGVIIIPISKRYILQHMDIQGDVLYNSNGGSKKIDHPVEFLTLLPIQQDLNRLMLEIENSVVNYALALTGAKIRKETFSWNDDVLSYLLTEKKKNLQFSPLVFAEQWVIEGHTLHPCSKTRLGMSLGEVTHYSPEWEGKPSVIPVAVHTDYVRMKSMEEESMTDILLKEYPHVAKSFREQLLEWGMENYELIPIHPWQLEHTIKPHFKEEIAQNIIVPLENAAISTSALMSFRSLAPNGSTKLHHVKTAVDVQMTSAKRIVSPTSISNGPVISSILKEIQINDPAIGHSLRFMKERAGGHFLSKNKDHGTFLMKNLSALLRENPEQFLDEDEIAVPAAFLINPSPFSGKLFLLELIEHYHRFTLTSIEKAAAEYIKIYANLLLPGLIKLIVTYGISLEAHLQNVVPVFRKGLPVRFLIRDLGGIRVKEDRLQRFLGTKPMIDNSTNLLTDRDKDLFTIFSHALLHNHLGEMIFFLSKELEMPEKKLWKPVKEVIFSTIDSLKDDSDCTETVQVLENELYSPLAPLKALVKMRLNDQVSDNAYTLVPNPLTN